MTELAKSPPGREAQRPGAYDSRPKELSLARRAQIPIISAAAYAFARMVGPTLRYEVLGWQHIDRVHARNRRCVYSFWHQTIFLAMWWWRHRGVTAMTSANFDGQILGSALQRLIPSDPRNYPNVSDFAWSPDGTKFAFVAASDTFAILDLRTEKAKRLRWKRRGEPRDLSWQPIPRG